jgi:cysteinyl-tRNA synthetase
MTLARQREKARAEKRWKDADNIRGEIAAAGFEVQDTPDGPRVKSIK